jgi:hypothetical protein
MGSSPCVQFRFGARPYLGILTWHVGSFGELQTASFRYHRFHLSPSKIQTRGSTRSIICRALQRRPASSYGSATRTVCARTTVPQGTLERSFETDSLPQITKRANSDILVGWELIQALLLLGTQRRKRAARMVVVELSSNVRRLQTHTSTRSGIWRSAVYPACNRRRIRPYYGSGMTRGAKSVDPEFAGAIVITRNPSVVEEVLELALAR